ncbi:hypothetical protein [[Eubacterium] cellulosolvens]
MIILTGGLIFFGFLALFGFALRDISRQKNWVLREYPTNLELCREKDKDNILKTIRNVLRSADLEVVEVPYKGRFPVELIKSYRVNDKIQIDICSKYSQKEFHAILPNKYQYFLVIFLGPVNEKNKALSNRIRHELDKTFL